MIPDPPPSMSWFDTPRSTKKVYHAQGTGQITILLTLVLDLHRWQLKPRAGRHRTQSHARQSYYPKSNRPVSEQETGNQQRRRVPVTRTRRWSAQLPASLGHRSQSGLPPLSHVHARPATSHLTPALYNSILVDTRRRDGGGREGRGRTVEPRGSGRGEGGRPPTRRSLTDSLGPSSAHPSTPP